LFVTEKHVPYLCAIISLRNLVVLTVEKKKNENNKQSPARKEKKDSSFSL
jgi:hypothetical protein